MELLNEPVEPKVAGMDKDGWSNSPAVREAPDDVHPDVTVDLVGEPGWSNVSLPKAQVKAIETAEATQPQEQMTRPRKSASKATSRKRG